MEILKIIVDLIIIILIVIHLIVIFMFSLLMLKNKLYTTKINIDLSLTFILIGLIIIRIIYF
jgi:hypothetical protein